MCTFENVGTIKKVKAHILLQIKTIFKKKEARLKKDPKDEQEISFQTIAK